MWHCLNHYAYSDAIFLAERLYAEGEVTLNRTRKLKVITISYFHTSVLLIILIETRLSLRNLPIPLPYSTTQSTFNLIPSIQLHKQILFQ